MQPLMAQNSISGGVNPHFSPPLANAPGPRDTLPLATGAPILFASLSNLDSIHLNSISAQQIQVEMTLAVVMNMTKIQNLSNDETVSARTNALVLLKLFKHVLRCSGNLCGTYFGVVFDGASCASSVMWICAIKPFSVALLHKLSFIVAAGTGNEMLGASNGAGNRIGAGVHAWSQPPLSSRPLASARNAGTPDTPGGGTIKSVKSGGGQKKMLTVSKTSKANARFTQAVPPGVDIMTDDLRGYVLECVFTKPAAGFLA
jgi:hypothetical protein